MSIQNRYNLDDRESEPLVDLCEQEQLAFLPWAPIQDLDGNPVVPEVADRHGATPAAGRAGLAAGPVAGDAADPRHRIGPRTSRRTSRPPRSS